MGIYDWQEKHIAKQDARIVELTAEVSRLRDALQTIADNPASLTGPDFTWTHWADIARNALKDG